MNPDPYRGMFKRDDPEAGKKYAKEVQNVIEHSTSGKVAAFIAEPIQGVGGTIELANGYVFYSHY
jgi:alanine-glyoxylate transaminase/(R)-3-amino-2-methylpropionate-pyruvate transaminase